MKTLALLLLSGEGPTRSLVMLDENSYIVSVWYLEKAQNVDDTIVRQEEGEEDEAE